MATRSGLAVAAANVLVIGAWLVCASGATAAEPAVPDFQADVLPLLKNRCVKCHGPAKQEGQLNLSLPTGIVRGGESGPVVVFGKPDESSLWQLVEADEMPKDEPLGGEEKGIFRAGSRPGRFGRFAGQGGGGCQWRRALGLRAARSARAANRSRCFLDSDSDRCVCPSQVGSCWFNARPRGGCRTLIRRVCFDLTGLPPTLVEIEDLGRQQPTSL